MSVNIFHKTGSGTGTLQKVAGNTVILDATTSETRAGTFNISRATSGSVSQNILFDNPMPDANYMVNFELTSGSGNDGPGLVITNKSTTGFTVTINTTGAADLSVEYNAFKLVELKDYTSMQNAILNADSSPTQNSENLIKSGGVFEALKGAGTVFTGTKSEWENLDPTEQERYEVVCITDDEESKLVDEYSLDEVKTNKVWIDGKPIYRKCWSLTKNQMNKNADYQYSYPHGIDIDTVIARGGWIQQDGGWIATQNIFDSNTALPQYNFEFGVTSVSIYAQIGSTIQSRWPANGGLKCWLEYTKN